MAVTSPAAGHVPVWTFWADLYTGPGQFTPIGPLQCSAFTYTSTLSDFGSGSATLLAGTASLTDTDLLRLWGWRLFAFHDDLPVWCGMPTGITDAGDPMAPVTLTEITGYLGKRAQDQNNLTFGQAEQVQIAAALAAPLSQVGVQVSASTTTQILRDRTYQLYEDTMGDLLTNLTQVINGPQFRTELTRPGAYTSPGVTMRIAYPRVGTDTGLGITVPGSTLSYSLSWDADQLRTRTIALGDVADDADVNAARPVSIVSRPQDTLPQLDMVDDWSGTVLTTTLAEQAETSATQYAEPVLSLQATASCADPPLGTYNVGDTVTVNVTDPLLPGGLSVTGQLTGLQVDATAATAQWTVAVSLPAPQPRQTLIQQLRTLNRNVRSIHRRQSRGVFPS